MPSPEDSLPTKLGPVLISSLKERKTVQGLVCASIERFFGPDIWFSKDESGYMGIFIAVLATDDTCHFYRTDRAGFSYKSAILFFNARSKVRSGACHFLVTEYKTGEWGMVALWSPIDEINFITGEYEVIERKGLFKGYRSEEEVIDAMKAKYYCDLLDDRFVRLDINSYIP